MNHFDELRSLIDQLTDRSSRKERGGVATQAHELISKIEALAPPETSEDAMGLVYEAGALKAMEIAKAVREQTEAPIKRAKIGAGYPVLNGLIHYGQDLLGAADQAVLAHLLERKKKP